MFNVGDKVKFDGTDSVYTIVTERDPYGRYAVTNPDGSLHVFDGKRLSRHHEIPPLYVNLYQSVDTQGFFWGHSYMNKADLEYEFSNSLGNIERIAYLSVEDGVEKLNHYYQEKS